MKTFFFWMTLATSLSTYALEKLGSLTMDSKNDLLIEPVTTQETKD